MQFRPKHIRNLATTGAALLVSTHLDAQILSPKRGFGDTGANYNNLQATGAGWYYTWTEDDGSPGTFDANHYPMFWHAPTQTAINNLKNTNPTYVLGFNEPERADQANMSVAQAITSWTAISNAFTGTSTKLVSPAVSDDGGGQAWLASFMSQANANNLKVDAIAFHWYGVSNPNDPVAAANSFLSRIDSYHTTYNLPIFMTEFAIHDWGGAYTDAQIIEANRQFLNVAIPGLESRSYVTAYAWFNWFSDAPLFSGSGSNLTPTPMSYGYIAARGNNTTTDISGQNLGEHVAPLAGGTLAMNGPAAGTIKFINALSGESSVAGSIDWGLASGSWVRIQPNATLIKHGGNAVTFGGGTMLNSGVLQVAQGTLRVNSTVNGNGTVRVTGGTLALGGTGSLSSTPLIDVRTGGALNVTNLAGGVMTITPGRTLNIDGNFFGHVVANTSATIAGAGSITGNLTTQSGATVRVGTDKLGVASRSVVDDFGSYATGDVSAVAGPAWTAHQSTNEADILDVSSNRALALGSTSTAFVGVSRKLPFAGSIDNNSTATYFFRVNATTNTPNHSFGLGDQASPAAVDFADFEAQLRVKSGSGSTFSLDARNGGTFSATLAGGLSLNTWYNVWMVVNQTTDKYDLYLNTGTGSATAANKLNATPLSLRNGTVRELNTFLAQAGSAPVANGVRLDDLVYQSGTDLTNPSAGFNPAFTWAPQTLSITGNYTQNAGATLQINIRNPASHDVLSVSGTAALDGVLAVQSVDGFVPLPGQSFDVLTFGSRSGDFGSVLNQTGYAGLSFDRIYTATSLSLLTTATGGDANLDGIVDVNDLAILARGWQATGQNWFGADFSGDGIVDRIDLGILAINWQSTSGSAFQATLESLGLPTTVPEPSCIALLPFSILPTMHRRRRRRRR